MNKFHKPIIIIISIVGMLVNGWAQPDPKILAKTNVSVLLQLADQYELQFQNEYAAAVIWAQSNGIPMKIITANGNIIELVGIRNNEPIYYGADNLNAAKTTATNKIQAGGSSNLDLTGDGITLGIWDQGKVRDTHQEFGSRVTLVDNSGSYDWHATHVSGTMIASGVVNNAKGMATEAALKSWNWSLDYSEMAAASATGLILSNHSYGITSGWNYDENNDWRWYGNINISTNEDYKFGFYNSTAETWDNVAFNAPYYLIVKSAGNDRNDTGPSSGGAHYHGNGTTVYYDSHDPDGGSNGFDCISTNVVAKNILSVGAG